MKKISCNLLKKKNIFLFFFFIFFIHSHSQTYIKVNPVTTLLTIPNVGVEMSIGKKATFQFDVLSSFWKSMSGKPKQYYIFIPEYRYFFHEKYDGFYVGAHIGATLFNFQKWNSYNSFMYQKGFGYVMGATVGYEKKISEKFLVDIYLGGGNSQGFYKGYFIGTDTRYESAKDYNKSGEWFPYRGGVMVSYKLN
ncbi:DUF3575 domain-containing protein [Flavobacterium sp. LB3R33]|uniref:DUF3575 domain-containing protein n=1 Tax=Flavobacterium sp. LB3R33 TaxID=3401721 RepID=UPI003AAD6F8D